MNFANTLSRPPLVRQRTLTLDEAPPGQQSLLSDYNNGDDIINQEHTNTTQHKRKQSDVTGVILGGELDLDIRQALVVANVDVDNSASSPSSLELQDADAEDDGVYYFDNRKRRWLKNPALKPHQIVILFVILAILTTSHRIRTKRSTSNQSNVNDSTSTNLDVGGFEEIGEAKEATLYEDWIELYNSPDRMPPMKSTGPFPVDHPSIGGMHMFENVCVTNNIDAPKELDTSMRGLIYFTNTVQHPHRCVPCSKSEMISKGKEASGGDGWTSCGMPGLHAIYANSVVDYNRCMKNEENHKLIIKAKQSQTPSYVEKIHYFQDPTFLLQFNSHDKERGLFDMLLTFLPYWNTWQKSSTYPFDSVISHSVQGCLTHSKNWLCEVLHQMGALGSSRQIPWERSDSTLYCYNRLYYNQLEYQRKLEHKGLVTKDVMDNFRDELFRNMALPSPRDQSLIREKDAKIGLKRPINIVLFDGEITWPGLGKLIRSAKSKKYHHIEFTSVDYFDGPLAEQAQYFNMADVVVMVPGDHWANAIFAPDSTLFIEVGCSPQSLISNNRFTALLSATYQGVAECQDNPSKEDICVTCSSEDNTFVMTEKRFHALLDDIVKRHEEAISFQRDSI